MTKIGKLFEKLRSNPTGATFAQIEKLLISEGFALDRVSGSHHVFKRDKIIFVVPVHKKRIKSIYVKRIIEIIEEEKS